jgi:hypothetical protein
MRTPAAAAAAALLSLCLVQHAAAQGRFSEGSEAASWGLLGEETARFEGRVVDVLCEIAGDCPAGCGGGRRQLGVLRAADGALVLAVKNTQPLFTGATVDLAPYCGETVVVDGLLIGDPDLTPTLGTAKLLQVQTVRRPGGEAVPTEAWTEAWRTRTGLPESEEPWFQRDPAVRAHLQADGYLGLGADEDRAFKAANP